MTTLEHSICGFGVPVSEIDDCMLWALGEGYGDKQCRDIDDLWRTQHPDLTPMFGDTDVIDGCRIIAVEYLNRTKEPACDKQ